MLADGARKRGKVAEAEGFEAMLGEFDDGEKRWRESAIRDYARRRGFHPADA